MGSLGSSDRGLGAAGECRFVGWLGVRGARKGVRDILRLSRGLYIVITVVSDYVGLVRGR